MSGDFDARIAALEATVADLEERLLQATEAEALIRRAHFGAALPTPRPAPRRLRSVQ